MVISFLVFLFVFCFMTGIGIWCLRSRNPVTFYTGEKPLKPEQVKDVKAWNRKHGVLWLCYAGAILLGYLGMWCIGDSLLALIPFVLGVLVPLPVMVLRHEAWRKTDLV